MFAVIRAGGKQYRVAPGDVIRIEKAPAENGRVEFTDVLAVSGGDGQIGRPGEGRVVGQVVSEGRGDKVLVFHYKRKKQYKRLRGHRQPFTEVQITEIAFDGQRFTAPVAEEHPRKQRAPEPQAAEAAAQAAAPAKKGKKTAGRSAAAKKSAGKKSGGKKKK
jgi:large subunit ribosomal protein L21